MDVRFVQAGEDVGSSDSILIPFRCSCRKRGDKWIVAMNKWQDLTDMEVNQGE